jgi:hypothetical protein
METVCSKAQTSKVLVIADWLGLKTCWTEYLELHAVSGARCAFRSKCLASKTTELMTSSYIVDFFRYIDAAEEGATLWFLEI